MVFEELQYGHNAIGTDQHFQFIASSQLHFLHVLWQTLGHIFTERGQIVAFKWIHFPYSCCYTWKNRILLIWKLHKQFGDIFMLTSCLGCVPCLAGHETHHHIPVDGYNAKHISIHTCWRVQIIYSICILPCLPLELARPFLMPTEIVRNNDAIYTKCISANNIFFHSRLTARSQWILCNQMVVSDTNGMYCFSIVDTTIKWT